MRKQILLFLAFVICATTLFAKETENKKDTYIFIDISGSASEIFSEIQDYAIDEILPSLNKETNLSIYKFYGKCVNIYDQKLKTDFDFEYAKERIQKLLPNGPWTNLDLVKSVIKEKNIDLAITNVFILTDGHQELENGENEYYLSQDNINEFLEDCDLINKGDWFLLVYKYKEKSTPVVIEEPVISIEPPVIQNKPVEKKTYNINFGIFKLIILILFFLCLFMYVISVISFFIWNILKNKSVKLKQFIDYYWSCFWRYVLCVCCVLANLLLYFFYSIMIPLVQIIFMILGIAKGVQKRTLERSKEDRQRPKRDSLNYAVSMFRINPEVSRLRIASDKAGSF